MTPGVGGTGGAAASRPAPPVTATGRRRPSPPAAAAAELRAAVAFLTRLPVASRTGSAERTGAAAFGLAGALAAVPGAIALAVAGAGHPGPAAVAAIASLAIVTGALHLDGLADTADALAAPPGAADRARTDPRAGTAGVVAVVLVLLLETTVLAELSAWTAGLAAFAFLTAAAASRAGAVIAAVVAGRSRSGGRLGAWFADRVRPVDAGLGLVTAAAIAVGGSIATGRPTIAVGLTGGALLAAAAAAAVVRLRRQLDGDGHGAIIELAFATILVATLAAAAVLDPSVTAS